MKTDELKVTEVLRRNERFIVPLYQRQYQWHDHQNYEGRTSAFWLDVVAKASEVLAGPVRFDHYMGALLLAPDTAPRAFSETPVMHVVDGQQRLTTFLILLAAMREIAREHDYTEFSKQVKKYLFNEPGKADNDPLTEYKLTPTPVDRPVFFDILNKPYSEVRFQNQVCYWAGRVPQNTPARALRAYEYFRSQIMDFIASETNDDIEVDIDNEQAQNEDAAETDEQNVRRRLDALLEALFHLKLIVITLGEEDDAQVIFETLNSKAQPLLAMDLVRNNVFHRAEAQYRGNENAREKAEQLYHKVWEPFDHGWWRENAPNARPARPRIDHFLAAVLTAETGERITVRELYANYRAWATPNRRPRFENVEDELAILQRHVPTYETLEGRTDGDEAIKWLGERLRLWQNTTAYPLAFLIAENAADQATRFTISRLIDSYLVRRIFCDLTQKNLNQFFPRLVAALREDGVSVQTVSHFFAGQDRDTTRFPNDKELRNGIIENRAYERIPSRILTDLLWSLELKSRTGLAEDTARPPDLWVEHVMPQYWEENWPLNGEIVTVNQEVPGYSERETALQTLGNLTITADKLNIAMSNLGFDKKAPLLVEHSNLTLNRQIAQNTNWDENTIRSRSEELANLAIRIWPAPP